MSKKRLYLLLLGIIFMSFTVSLYDIFQFGLTTGPIYDATVFMARANSLYLGNDYDLATNYKGIEIFDAYPPGYSIFISTLRMLTGFDNLETYIAYRVVFMILFILLGYVIGHTIKDVSLGLLISVFMAIPPTTGFTFTSTEVIPIMLVRPFPNLSGSITDFIFIFMIIWLFFSIYRNYRDNTSFIVLLTIILVSFGLSHLSRYLMFFVNLTLFVSLAFFFSRKGSTRLSLVVINFSLFLSLTLIYVFYYFQDFNQLGQSSFDNYSSKFPSFINNLLFSDIFNLFLAISLLLLIYLMYYFGRSNFSSGKIEILRFKYFWQLIFIETLVVIYLTSTRPYLLTAGVPGPYYFGSFLSISDFFILSLYVNTLIIFILLFFGINFLNKSRYAFGYILSSIFSINLFVLIISILTGFQPNRMGIHIYFIPIIYSAGLYFLISKAISFKRFTKFHSTKIVLTFLLVAIFFTNNLTLMYDSTISSPNKTEIVEYDNRLRNSTVISNIHISSNLINHLDIILDDGEMVITLPQTQGVIAAYIDINTIHEDLIIEAFFRDDLPSLFENLNITYLVLSHNDIKPLFERSTNTLSSTNFPIEYYDDKDYLDLVYCNSIGERVYKYNIKNV